MNFMQLQVSREMAEERVQQCQLNVVLEGKSGTKEKWY